MQFRRDDMNNEYWFKAKDGSTLRLAVPVEEVPENLSVDIQSFSILKKGEICFFSGIKASDIKISSFFPARNYSFCQYSDFPSPEESKAFFKRVIDSQDPLTFIMTGTDINKEYFIEKFSTVYKQGREDLFFTLELKEAPKLTIEKSILAKKEKEDALFRASKKAENNTSKISSVKNQRVHTVSRNETLTGIAHKYYGKTGDYRKIFNANKPLIKNPNIIKVGWKLIIP